MLHIANLIPARILLAEIVQDHACLHPLCCASLVLSPIRLEMQVPQRHPLEPEIHKRIHLLPTGLGMVPAERSLILAEPWTLE